MCQTPKVATRISQTFRTQLTRKQMYFIRLQIKGGNGLNLFGLKRSNPYLVSCHFGSYWNNIFLYILADYIYSSSISSICKLAHQFLNPRCHFLWETHLRYRCALCKLIPTPNQGGCQNKNSTQFSRPFLRAFGARRKKGLGTRLRCFMVINTILK